MFRQSSSALNLPRCDTGLCHARTQRLTGVCAAAPTTTVVPKEAEYSRMVNHELTLFLFQLVRLLCAMPPDLCIGCCAGGSL